MPREVQPVALRSPVKFPLHLQQPLWKRICSQLYLKGPWFQGAGRTHPCDHYSHLSSLPSPCPPISCHESGPQAQDRAGLHNFLNVTKPICHSPASPKPSPVHPGRLRAIWPGSPTVKSHYCFQLIGFKKSKVIRKGPWEAHHLGSTPSRRALRASSCLSALPELISSDCLASLSPMASQKDCIAKCSCSHIAAVVMGTSFETLTHAFLCSLFTLPPARSALHFTDVGTGYGRVGEGRQEAGRTPNPGAWHFPLPQKQGDVCRLVLGLPQNRNDEWK